MNCPKCGYQQEGGRTCLRCGIIFIPYHSVMRNPNSTINPDTSTAQPTERPLRRFYRIFRWVALTGLVVVLFLMLRPSTPPQVAVNPEVTKRAEAKIEEFQSSLGQGNEHRLEMDQSELNGWLSKNLVLKQPAGSKPALPLTSESSTDLGKIATGGQPFRLETLEQLQSSVRDVKIELLYNELRIYALFDFHGVDLSLELEGKPVVRDGYIKLEPSGGKLGSLPMTAGTLKSITNHLFDSSQNKEKFQLSPDIQAVRIEQGQLIVISR